MKDPTAKSTEIKRRCSNPTNGCVVCKEYVCGLCWPTHVEEVRQNRPNRNIKKRPFNIAQLDEIRSGSVILESLFATNGTNWKKYVETIWGRKSCLFTYDADVTPMAREASIASFTESDSKASSKSSLTFASARPTRPANFIPAVYGGDGRWRETTMVVFPLKEIIRQGWYILTTLMDASKTIDGTTADHIGGYCQRTMVKVSITRNFHTKTRDEILNDYNGDLYAAYLSGCSIDWDNCDMISPHIAVLCQDLKGEQDRKGKEERGGAFIQAHSTAHLTLPQSPEKFPARTNNKSIFVFQLVGRKYWKTSWNKPGDAPRSKEPKARRIETQDGRSAESKSEETDSFDDYLYPGDVLYIPKGMPYETQSSKTTPDNSCEDNDFGGACDPSISFHVTVTVDEIDETYFEDEIESIANRPSTVPDEPFSSSNVACTIIQGTGNQNLGRTSGSDHDKALARKRTLLVDESRNESQSNKRPKKSRPGGQRTILPRTITPHILDAKSDTLLDAVLGPIAASRISFSTEIRALTQSERRHGQEMLSIRFPEGRDERWETGIRSEIRDVTEVIATRIRSFSPGYGRSMRVVDLCDIVKNTIEDKSELSLVCDLTMLALVKREVEAGHLAVVPSSLVS